MTTILADVTEMFGGVEPWDCSNSVANLGQNAGRSTWHNALQVAAAHSTWLKSPLADACEGMRAWAADTGAWERAEIKAWSVDECLALLVQNIASELRTCLDSDNQDFVACVATYNDTDWDQQSEYPIGCYTATEAGKVLVSYYTGC